MTTKTEKLEEFFHEKVVEWANKVNFAVYIDVNKKLPLFKGWPIHWSAYYALLVPKHFHPNLIAEAFSIMAMSEEATNETNSGNLG